MYTRGTWRTGLLLPAIIIVVFFACTACAKDADRSSERDLASRFAAAHKSGVVLAVVRNEGEETKLVEAGNGFVVGTHSKLILSAKHVGDAFADSPDYHIYALIGTETCLLTRVWAHEIADVILWRPTCKQRAADSLTSITLSRRMPAQGEPVFLVGYQVSFRTPRAQISDACPKFLAIRFCGDRVLLFTQGTKITMEEISIPEEESRRNMLKLLQKTDPRLRYEDIFWNEYIVALRAENDQYRDLAGFSGAALVNARGDVIGVFSGGAGKRAAFTPLYALPRELLEENLGK